MNSALGNIWNTLEGEVVDGKYHLTRLIASGGFGGVFEADEVIADQLIRRVAIKLISPDTANAAAQIQELVLAASLDSDALVRSFNPGQCAIGNLVVLYIVMELASDTLANRIADGPVDEQTARAVVQSTLTALDYLTRRDEPLVHRDVKPDNLLLVGTRWKLADFGLLRSIDPSRETRTASLLGTAEYAPPEAFDGIISPAWDIWSVGVMIVEMLSGSMPFTGVTPEELQAAILKGAPAHGDGLPEPFRTLASRCLSKNRNNRPNASQALDLLRGEFVPAAATVTEVVEAKSEIALRRATFPFRFKYGSADTLAELVGLCDEYPYEAIDYLQAHYFSKWLLDGLHEPSLAQDVRTITVYHTRAPHHALEMMMRLLRGAAGLPSLPVVIVKPERLDFGMVSVGAKVLEAVRYECKGAGHIWGSVAVEGDLPGITAATEFFGDGAPIHVTLDTLLTTPGLYKGRVLITPVGFDDPIVVPVSYTVAPLKVAIEPPRIDLGDIEHGEVVERPITVSSKDGKARLSGSAVIFPPCEGVTVTGRFQGSTNSLNVSFNTAALEANREYVRRVRIETTGGRFEVPIRLQVVARRQGAKIWPRVGAGAAAGALIFALIRWIFGSLLGDNHVWALTQSIADTHEAGCRMLGTPLLAFATGALFRMLCRWRWPLLFEAHEHASPDRNAPPEHPPVDDDGRIDLRHI